MPEISDSALREVQEAFEFFYRKLVDISDLSLDSKDSYKNHANRFVRWLAGERIDVFER